MKIMAVDYGRRRIGLAVADDIESIARGLDTLENRGTAEAIEDIAAIVAKENPDLLAVGLPLGKDDGETVMSKEIRRFTESLISRTHVAVRYIDESYTSMQATDALMHRKQHVRRRKSNIDRIAACLILQACQREILCELV